MRQKRFQLLAVLAVAVLAVQPVTAATMQAGGSSVQLADQSVAIADSENASVDSSPPDPETDRLGWENGVWYNESIAVDASDGIDRAESARLLNRTMARIEMIRGVEFNEPVDLNFINRSAYAEHATSGEINQTAVNVQLEALGFVGEDGNATAAVREYQGGSAAAFVSTQPNPALDLQAGDVAIVMDDGQASYRELTLAHELVHTLQVQELNVTFRGGNLTTDTFNARRGLIEGEASHVGYLYEQRCGADWECVIPDARGGQEFSDAAVGLSILNSAVQYSNGAEFVATLRDRGGWDAVTDAYDRFPNSTEQIIHPQAYRSDEPQHVAVPDRSGPDWRPLSVDNGTATDILGEAGLFTMLWFPSFESGQSVVMSPVIGNRSLRAQFPFYHDYDHDATRGWDGDRLVPYVSEESGETGYVWSTVWDSSADAATFEDAYLDILEYRGAEPVEGHESTYRIPEEKRFGDAFYLNRSGESFTIVNAPSVDELSAVREGAGPEAAEETTETDDATPTESDGTTEDEVATATDTETAPAGETDTPSTDTTSTSGPGFTVVSVLVAIVALGSVAFRRS